MPRTSTKRELAGFTASPLLAKGETVLPAGAIVGIGAEARGILALRPLGARAAVGIALPVRQREAGQVDVRRRRLLVGRHRRAARLRSRRGWRGGHLRTGGHEDERRERDRSSQWAT